TYQGVMSGFSQAFGESRTTMLFMHDESLVNHADTEHPPVHADAAAQAESLGEFFSEHHNEFGGMLLDDVWQDDVLERFAPQLKNAAVVCRPSRLAGVSSVSPDYDRSGLLAIGHLYARGFEEIWLAIPFTKAEPVDLMGRAARRAAEALGRPLA